VTGYAKIVKIKLKEKLINYEGKHGGVDEVKTQNLRYDLEVTDEYLKEMQLEHELQVKSERQ